MNNLSSFGVQDMNTEEIREIQGGFFGIDDFLVGAGIAVVAGVIADWDNFKIGISGGY